MAPAIDAVYTWVDGSDELFRANLRRALHQRDCQVHAPEMCFRDNDELRFSLRSLTQFAPWVRKIHLVTNGQKPGWLNQFSPNLHLVRHEDIFPDSGCLPTFNSNAIELNLHRIPGLSRKFLYFNDDLFIGRPCSLDDFITDSGDITYYEEIDLDTELDREMVSDQACLSTRSLVSQRLGILPISSMPAHVPQLYDRDVVAEIEANFQWEFEQTRKAAFRSQDDFILRISYAMVSAGKGNPVARLISGSTDYSLLRLMPGVLDRFRDFRYVYRQRPRFFCINDELMQGAGRPIVAWMMRAFLRMYYPEQSCFERNSHHA